MQSTTGKLNALADNFNHFYGDLEEETTVRKQAEESRVIRIERECGKLERVIGTETKRRIEASKALQAMFENQLVKIQKEFKEDLRETYEPLQEQIDALIGRVERLEKTMEVRPGSGRAPQIPRVWRGRSTPPPACRRRRSATERRRSREPTRKSSINFRST